eukprot:scaffold62254_cov72-Phaeocystis_antarctica.AAC.1
MSWSPMGCAGVDGGAGAGVAGASAAGWLWASTPGGRVDWAIFWRLHSVHTSSRRFGFVQRGQTRARRRHEPSGEREPPYGAEDWRAAQKPTARSHTASAVTRRRPSPRA